MSDTFIPLNQSTPVHNQKRWQGRQGMNFQQGGQLGSWNQQQHARNGGFYKQSNNFGNGNNSSQDKGIDAYLHPSMLQDPWSYLRRKNAENQSF